MYIHWNHARVRNDEAEKSNEVKKKLQPLA